MIKNIINNFRKYSFLMQQIISRDFKVKYKRSVLGVLWSLLYPVMMMTVMAIVFSQMFRFNFEGTNFLVYLMTGQLLFNYFSEATSISMTSVVTNFSLINKVYIPKYIFPLAKCLFVGINFLLTLIPWLVLIILTQFGVGGYAASINFYYLLFPFIFLCLFLFTLGISFLLACVSVFLRDMFYIYGIILTIWQFFTPIFYPLEILPYRLQTLFQFNPMFQFINAIRTIVLEGRAPSLFTLSVLFGVGVVTLIIGGAVFKKNQDKFIYYV